MNPYTVAAASLALCLAGVAVLLKILRVVGGNRAFYFIFTSAFLFILRQSLILTEPAGLHSGQAPVTFTGELFSLAALGFLLVGALLLIPIIGGSSPGLRETEKIIQKKDRFLAAVLSASPVGFCLIRGRALHWVNDSFCRMVGYDAEALQDKTTAMLYPDVREFERVGRQLYDRKDEARISRVTTRLVLKDGSIMHCLLQAASIDDDHPELGKLVAVMDVTELKQMADALEESEERYRRYFEEDLAAAYVSTPQGQLLSCNPAFVRIFGFSSVEQAIMCDLHLLYPEPAMMESFLGLLRKVKKMEHHHNQRCRSDGNIIHVIENAVGSFNRQGELVEIKGYIIDATHQKNLEEQLRQSQKMEAIGRLAGGIAHDFNNLLTAITGYADSLVSGLKHDDTLGKSAREIRKASERAASLTSQLLAFSRKQVLQPKILSLGTVISGMEEMLRRFMGEDIELLTGIPSGLWPIKADRGQIEQVVMNLAVNARDAMPDGGRLIIEASNIELDTTYAKLHMSVSPGSYVMLAVSDTGTGMTDDVMAHLFEPFFTTKGEGRGTGLGLATVYGIVKQSDGHIWVYTEPGKGATFKVYLPRAEGGVHDLSPVTDNVTHACGHETILLVEDDDLVRDMICDGLRRNGYKVLNASHGGDALRICSEFSGPIHLLLTDVVMPGMNGRELAERIAESHPQIKTLFISGYTDRAIVHNGVLDPETDFLQKPFNMEMLARKVREILCA